MDVARRTVTAVAAVLVAAALHCGGKVEGEPVPDCPRTGACTAACQVTVESRCGSTRTQCDCVDGRVACAEMTGAPMCDPCGVPNISAGVACTATGARCPASVQTDCYSGSMKRMCTCDGKTFACEPDPPDCHMPVPLPQDAGSE